jgi:2,4-dienoyl-CoA reductase-like NADH-dependent reductase (Old Yellow Enzyme family)
VVNRARFPLETIDTLSKVWPADWIGVHLNLMSSSHSMKDSDPAALFGYVAEQLSERELAFILGRESPEGDTPRLAPLVRQKFKGAFIANEGLTQETAARVIAAGEADAAAFGKLYVANPDLVERFRRKAPLNPLNSATIYAGDASGYNDYPMLDTREGRA